MDNSIKACQEGDSVSISTSTDNGNITVSVTDTGVGISIAHLPHVFERFYKVDRSRGGSGTGLGLAIAKYIVQAHRGDIKALSSEGEGSTFSFTLPSAQR